MRIPEKVSALLTFMKPEDLDAMPPASRERFAQLCRHWSELAAKTSEPPKSGVLLALSQERAH